MTLIKGTSLQPVIYSHTIIKYETLAFPLAFRFRHLFEVLQNPAFEVIDILKPLLTKIRRGFFAANTSCSLNLFSQFVSDPD